MSLSPALAALYQDLILTHHESPRGRGPLDGATHEARQENPLCGDRVTLRLRVDGGTTRVAQVGFEGDGCALSIASASLLCERLAGLTLDEARALLDEVRRLLARGPEHESVDRARLGDLVALEGTRQFPARIRCALLPWEALGRALPPAGA